MSNPVRVAAAQLAGLSANGRVPEPGEVAKALTRLKVARIDREIRQAQASAPAPDPAEAAHLVGLLLSWGGNDQQSVATLTRCIREALYVTSDHLTPDDLATIAQMVLASGDDA